MYTASKPSRSRVFASSSANAPGHGRFDRTGDRRDIASEPSRAHWPSSRLHRLGTQRGRRLPQLIAAGVNRRIVRASCGRFATGRKNAEPARGRSRSAPRLFPIGRHRSFCTTKLVRGKGRDDRALSTHCYASVLRTVCHKAVVQEAVAVVRLASCRCRLHSSNLRACGDLVRSESHVSSPNCHAPERSSAVDKADHLGGRMERQAMRGEAWPRRDISRHLASQLQLPIRCFCQ